MGVREEIADVLKQVKEGVCDRLQEGAEAEITFDFVIKKDSDIDPALHVQSVSARFEIIVENDRDSRKGRAA